MSESVLRALIRQVDFDRDSGYWRDREQRGIHHPEEIKSWLASLIDFGWVEPRHVVEPEYATKETG